MTISGSGKGTLSAIETDSLKTVTASSATGDVTVDLDDQAANLGVTMGSGDDTVILGATYTDADTLDGGDGTDTLGLAIAQASGPSKTQSNVSNFENLTITNTIAAAATVNTAYFGVTEGIGFDADATAKVTVQGLTSGSTVVLGKDVDDMDLDLNLADAADSGDQSVTIDYNDATAANAGDIDLDLAGIELVTFDASDESATTATGQAIDIANAQLKTLTITAGANTLDFTGTALGTVVSTVDASSSAGAGGVKVELSSSAVTGATITGTKNADDLTGSSQGDTITVGEGADSVTGGLGTDSIDLTETTAAEDVYTYTGGLDNLTGFDYGGTATDDNIVLTKAGIETVAGITAGSNLNGGDITAGAASLQTITGAATLSATGNILVANPTGNIASTDALEDSIGSWRGACLDDCGCRCICCRRRNLRRLR